MMSTILRNVRTFTELKGLSDDSGNVDPTVEQVVGGGDTQVSFSLVRMTHLQILLDAFIVLPCPRRQLVNIIRYTTLAVYQDPLPIKILKVGHYKVGRAVGSRCDVLERSR